MVSSAVCRYLESAYISEWCAQNLCGVGQSPGRSQEVFHSCEVVGHQEKKIIFHSPTVVEYSWLSKDGDIGEGE